MVGTFRSTDSNAKHLFVNHPAPGMGHGMDGVILRDKDANTAWATAMDGAREDRTYYCQNWRGDVVMLLNSDSTLKETIRYSAYGVPFGIPFGDVDGDGDVDAGDSDQLIEWESSRGYTPRGDLDLDGDIDFTDTAIQGAGSGTLGRGALSQIGNRKGYAGYEHDGVFSTVCHVRNRVLLTELGRWTRRDPLGYVDGMSVYEYATSRAVMVTDQMGFQCGEPGQSWTGTPCNGQVLGEIESANPGDNGGGGGPGPSCAELANRAKEGAEGRRAWTEAVVACQQRDTPCVPTIECARSKDEEPNCTEGVRAITGFNKNGCPRITLCPGMPPEVYEEVIVHESRHVWQLCRNGDARNDDEYICREIDAYQQPLSPCLAIGNNAARRDCLCLNSCKALHPQGNNPTDEQRQALERCKTRCMDLIRHKRCRDGQLLSGLPQPHNPGQSTPPATP